MPQNQTELIEKIYVLSVKTFTERIAHIQEELSEKSIEFEFIFDNDIPEIDPIEENKIFGVEKKITPAERSLVLKHITAWKKCIQHNYKRILILEDDVILSKTFWSDINSIIDSITQKKILNYLIFIGGADTRVPKEFFITKDSLFMNPIGTTDGYITDLHACQKRMNWLQENIITLPSDHLLRRMDKELNILQFWSTKTITQQGSVFGKFASTLDKKRMHHSNTYNLARYRLKILTRRTIPKIYYKLMNKIFNESHL